MANWLYVNRHTVVVVWRQFRGHLISLSFQWNCEKAPPLTNCNKLENSIVSITIWRMHRESFHNSLVDRKSSFYHTILSLFRPSRYFGVTLNRTHSTFNKLASQIKKSFTAKGHVTTYGKKECHNNFLASEHTHTRIDNRSINISKKMHVNRWW